LALGLGDQQGGRQKKMPPGISKNEIKKCQTNKSIENCKEKNALKKDKNVICLKKISCWREFTQFLIQTGL